MSNDYTTIAAAVKATREELAQATATFHVACDLVDAEREVLLATEHPEDRLMARMCLNEALAIREWNRKELALRTEIAELVLIGAGAAKEMVNISSSSDEEGR